MFTSFKFGGVFFVLFGVILLLMGTTDFLGISIFKEGAWTTAIAIGIGVILMGIAMNYFGQRFNL